MKHLLVVDADQQSGEKIKQLAEALGYQVTVVNTLVEVKQLLGQTADIFLATVDYRITDANDGEAIDYLLDQGIAVVAMTAQIDDDTCNHILDLPVVDYLLKEDEQITQYLPLILQYQLSNHGVGVLVVDDSLTARGLVIELLERRNYTVYDAASGEDALQTLDANPDIKMVITDNIMPGMSGIELVKAIRQKYSKNEVMVIGLSSSSKDFLSARFIKNGADDFLHKPFCPEEFYCRVMQNFDKLRFVEQIQHTANTDYLTSLYNRRYFCQVAEDIFHQAGSRPEVYVLAMADLDYFKRVNDNYGHKVGDLVLIAFSALMGKHFPNGLLARLGGEEFAIILSDQSLDKIEQQLQAFCHAVAEHVVEFDEGQLQFTVSMGAALIKSTHNLEYVLSKADLALYQAKEAGRNQLVLYHR